MTVHDVACSQPSCCTSTFVWMPVNVVIAALFYVCGEAIVPALILEPVHHDHHVCNSAAHTPTAVALTSTEPLSEMSTRDISWWVKVASPSHVNCLEILETLTC